MDFDNKANSIVQLIKEIHPFINSKKITIKRVYLSFLSSYLLLLKSKYTLKESFVNRSAVSGAGSVYSEAGSATLVIFK